jgi:hypothetical protein
MTVSIDNNTRFVDSCACGRYKDASLR